MAFLSKETPEEILNRGISQLLTHSQITRLSSGSKVRLLLGIMASEISKLEDIINSNIILGTVGGASGLYLDLIGDLVGVSRYTNSASEVDASSQVIRVYTPNGESAKELNNGAGILIPAGTIISSSDKKTRYATAASALLEPNSTFVFIGARSIRSGREGNISKGTLTNINLTSYKSYPDIQLKVENLSAIENGSDDEPDDLFRYRIQNALLSTQTANATALRLAALSVPSVSNVIILDLYRGIGTADLIVDSQFGAVDTTTLIQVQNKISQVSAVGMNVQVRPPRDVGLQVTIRPRFSSGTSSAAKSEAKSAIRGAISNLISEVQLGDTLPINDIAFVARGAHPSISDLGRPNKPLEQTILWRDSFLKGRVAKEIIEKNITLEPDERLVLETSLSEAIRILE